MPAYFALILLMVAVGVSGAIGYAMGLASAGGRGPAGIPPDPLAPALAERDAFIEHLRETAWQHRDVSPELATIVIDEITTHRQQLNRRPKDD